MIAERERKVKDTAPGEKDQASIYHSPVALFFIMIILSAMKKNLLIFAFFSLLIAGCSTSRLSTVEPGPPGLRPWQRPYTVFGERYVPMLSANGYKEEGFASWYGEEEHGKPTSNGEVFDMYQMTAAHKTLPLGCRVRVTSKANGKQTVVRVNDRGPFVAGRLIDLSYQAAKELDMLEGGLMPVAVEVIGDAPPTLTSTVTVAKKTFGETYALQLAAFSVRNEALQLIEKLKKDTAYSEIQPVQTEKGFFYRVRAGRYPSREDAEAAKASFARMGYPDVFVVTLR